MSDTCTLASTVSLLSDDDLHGDKHQRFPEVLAEHLGNFCLTASLLLNAIVSSSSLYYPNALSDFKSSSSLVNTDVGLSTTFMCVSCLKRAGVFYSRSGIFLAAYKLALMRNSRFHTADTTALTAKACKTLTSCPIAGMRIN